MPHVRHPILKQPIWWSMNKVFWNSKVKDNKITKSLWLCARLQLEQGAHYARKKKMSYRQMNDRGSKESN